MTEGKIVAWLKDAGSFVHAGEAVFEVETEKIVNEVECQADGVLLRQIAAVDDICAVGAPVGVLGPGDTPGAVIDEFVQSLRQHFSEVQQQAGGRDEPEPMDLVTGQRSIRYLSLGLGNIPALLIHGIGSDLNGWLFNQQQLATVRSVIAMDLAGHGGSSKTLETGDLDELSQGVIDLLDELKISKAHLIGHSLGGSVAAYLAQKQPWRVQSVSLISSLGPGTAVSETFLHAFLGATRRRELQQVVAQLVVHAELITRDFLENILRVKRIEAVHQSWQKIAERVLIEPARQRLGSVSESVLAQLEVPLQVIFGAEDQIVAVPRAEELPEGVQLQVLADAGHIPQMEAAARVNALLLRFLAAHDS